MIDISEYLKQSKPDVSTSTVKAYTVNLEKLHDRLHGTRGFENLDWMRDTAAVLSSLETHCTSYLTRRNYLNAVIVILLKQQGFESELRSYQERRDKYNDQYTEIQQTKEPSAKQAANWVPLSEIKELITEYDGLVKQLRSQADLTVKDKTVFQDRFMLRFWTTYPMRNDLNHTEVISKRDFNALDQLDKDNRNFIILGKVPMLSIGSYKTRKKYGVKKVELTDKDVVKAMNQWLTVSPDPTHILVNIKDGTSMSSLHITQNLTRIFKKHFQKSVGSTLLRHIVLTEKFGKQLEDMEHMADIMAHSVSTQQQIYIKNVDSEPEDGSPTEPPSP
eukprot:COSAG06_NODE_6_length_38168_cov_131.592398_30_plen_333_part_00